MPEKKTIKRARKAARKGKAPTTQAGEFVREEIHHVREGKHGARSTRQAIAIGLSKARRRSEAAPTEEGNHLRQDPAERGARLSQRPERPQEEGLRRALPRHQGSPQA
jgi:hypothetical protein